MIKLITPPQMLVTVALLAVYGALAVAIGRVEHSWGLHAFGVAAFVASYGVAMLRPWSRHLVYVLTAGFALKFGSSIYEGVSSGYFAFQFGSSREAMLSLAPAIVLLALSFVSCSLVYRHFNAKPLRPRIPTG